MAAGAVSSSSCTCPTRLPDLSSLGEPAVDERHEVDELNVAAARCARLRALQHDRAERTRGDDGVRAGLLELLEADVADPRARLLFLVGEQESAAGPAAIRVVAVSLWLLHLGAEA